MDGVGLPFYFERWYSKQLIYDIVPSSDDVAEVHIASGEDVGIQSSNSFSSDRRQGKHRGIETDVVV